MDFRLNAGEQAFIDDVNTFLDAEIPANLAELVPDFGNPDSENPFVAQFEKKLANKGWMALAWPKAVGGFGATHKQQMLFNEAMSYRRAPVGFSQGVAWVGPSIMLFGTDEQKAAHLSAIANNDERWCTLYSEPGAGSDLAALQTRAVRDGDEYVVTGQKIWTSLGHNADFGWLAARTDPEAPKHKGVSMFILDMKSPGLTLRPLVNMAGRHEFNEVFFEDVRIPARNMVGEENRGWYTMAAALDFERSSIAASAGARRNLEDLIELCRESAPGINRSPAVKTRLAERAIEIQTARLLSYNVVSLQERGVAPNVEASVAKLFSSELGQRLAATAMSLLGMGAQLYLDSKGAVHRGQHAVRYLSSVSSTIAGGTSEIQRNVVATRGLGLPR